VIEGILFTFIGAIIGWIGNWYYSRQGAKELREQFDRQAALLAKLPQSLITALAADARQRFTAEQLDDLVRTVGGLEQMQRPRTLSQEQNDHLVSELKKLSPQPVIVTSLGNDAEAQEYREQIASAFGQAGWPARSRDALAGIDVAGVAVGYYAGHSGHEPPSAPPSDDAIRLRAALEAGGIRAHLNAIGENQPSDYRFHIIVGQKPTLEPRYPRAL